MSTVADQVLVLANPKSGASSGRGLVSQLRESLVAHNMHVHICERLEELSARTAQLAAAGTLRAVVAAGGDGTAAAVVNRVPRETPLVVFPLGTENLLAKYAGASRDIRATTETILHGKPQLLDAGLAGGRLFLIMLSCGFDAQVVQQVHADREGHLNRWTYGKPIWRALRNYKYPLIDVEFGDGIGRERAAWLFAFNLPRYAANLSICPQACGTDGLLDVCTLARGGSWRGFYYLIHIWLGRHQRLVDFRTHQVKRFRLSSVDQVAYQVDGDPGGVLPLEVEVLPRRFTLLVHSHGTHDGSGQHGHCLDR